MVYKYSLFKKKSKLELNTGVRCSWHPLPCFLCSKELYIHWQVIYNREKYNSAWLLMSWPIIPYVFTLAIYSLSPLLFPLAMSSFSPCLPSRRVFTFAVTSVSQCLPFRHVLNSRHVFHLAASSLSPYLSPHHVFPLAMSSVSPRLPSRHSLATAPISD